MSKIIKKLDLIFFSIVYFTIPLIFWPWKNIYNLFGVNIFWFERFKVFIFFTILFLYLFIKFFDFSLIKTFFKKVNLNHLLFILLLSISFVFSIDKNISFFWNFEKPHWLLFIFSLLFFWYFLHSIYSKQLEKHIIKILIFSLYWIFLFSILELIFNFSFSNWLFLANSYRINSTLGNPNYLAWYSLLLLPIVLSSFEFFSKVRFFQTFIIFFLLIFSQSIIWIWIFILYLFYKFILYKKYSKTYFYLFISLIIFSLIIIWFLSDFKSWSIMTRFVLWKDSFNLIFFNFKTFLLWYWPDTLGIVFENYRSSELLSYVSKSIFIDSTHNILLDIIFSYWIITFWLILYLLRKVLFGLQINWQKEVAFLFFIFFFFNIPVLPHYLIFIFSLVSFYEL